MRLLHSPVAGSNAAGLPEGIGQLEGRSINRPLEFGRLQYGEPVEASPSPSGRGCREAAGEGRQDEGFTHSCPHPAFGLPEGEGPRFETVVLELDSHFVRVTSSKRDAEFETLALEYLEKNA